MGNGKPDGSIGSLVNSDRITISKGTLINNDTVQSNVVTNESLGIIAGTGLFTNISSPTTLLTNGGTVIPGDPATCGTPGILTVEGTYVQTSAGTLQIHLAGPIISAKLEVAGTPGQAFLDGTLSVDVSCRARGFPGHHVTVLDATGGVFGTFANVIAELPPTLQFGGVQYFPNSVEITLDPTMVDYLGGFTHALFTTVNQINNRLERQMESVKRRMSKWDPDECCVSESRPWKFYIGPVGSVGDLKHGEDQVGADFTTIGGLAGIDYAFCQFGVGLEVDYERIHAHGNHRWGKFDIDQAHASLYADYVPLWLPDLAVNAIVGGGYEWYSFRRNTFINDINAKGSPHGCQFDALFGIEYDFDASTACNEFHFVPLANVQYIHLNVEKYTEDNADGFDMKIGHQHAKSLRSGLGFRSNYTWKSDSIVFVPEFSFTWQREFLDKDRDVDVTPVFFGLPEFSLEMAGLGRNIWMGGIDLLATICDSYGVEASYDFEWNKRYTNNFFYLGLKYNF